jgi:FdhD protein
MDKGDRLMTVTTHNMENSVERFPLLQFTRESGSEMEMAVAREFPLTIILNDEELVTLLCSPQYLNYLAIGFLASEGLIDSKDEIK